MHLLTSIQAACPHRLQRQPELIGQGLTLQEPYSYLGTLSGQDALAAAAPELVACDSYVEGTNPT